MRWTVHQSDGEPVANFADTVDAADFVARLGAGAFVSCMRSVVVWTEGRDTGSAVKTMLDRASTQSFTTYPAKP